MIVHAANVTRYTFRRLAVLLSILAIGGSAAAVAGATLAGLPLSSGRTAVATRLKSVFGRDSSVIAYRMTHCASTTSTSVACSYHVDEADGTTCVGVMTAFLSGKTLFTKGYGFRCTSPPLPPVATTPTTTPSPAPPPTVTVPPVAVPPVVVPTGGGIYFGTNSSHPLLSKASDGSVVKLLDGSQWLISPLDRYKLVLWLPVSTIVVTTNAYNFTYPYQLINTSQYSPTPVAAKFLGY